MTKPGETVLGVDEGNHLHIVLSTETDAGQVAIANFTTHYESHRRRPTGCLIIAPHEHPWLRHESVLPMSTPVCSTWSGLIRRYDKVNWHSSSRVPRHC